MYGLAAFTFAVGGILLFVNGTPALIAGACMFIAVIMAWLAVRKP